MKKKYKQNLLLFLIFVSSVLGIFLFKRRYDKYTLKNGKLESKSYKKNALLVKRIVNKETEILNVFTVDYVLSAFPYAVAKDEKNYAISSIYTDKAKEVSKKIKLCDNENLSLIDVEKECLQVKDFIIKLNKILPNAIMVIHVVSEKEVEKYRNLIKEISTKIDLGIEVKINSEILETIFAE